LIFTFTDADTAVVYFTHTRPNSVFLINPNVNSITLDFGNTTNASVVLDDVLVVSGSFGAPIINFDTPGILVTKGLPSTDPLVTLKFLASISTPSGTSLTAEVAPDGTTFTAIGLDDLSDLTPAQVSPNLKFRFTLTASGDLKKTPTLKSVSYATDNSVPQIDFLAAVAKINQIIASTDHTAQQAIAPL